MTNKKKLVVLTGNGISVGYSPIEQNELAPDDSPLRDYFKEDDDSDKA